jgi:hypothetical protein
MAIPLRDLTPYGDVKGGSPRTPSGGIPVQEYQQYAMGNGNGNGNGVWKSVACGCAGLMVGLLLAWFTALQGKGVTQKEMQEYIIAYYATEKRVISEHTSQQDTYIGILQGKQEKIIQDLSECKVSQKEHDRDITEIREKLKLAANYLEEQQKVKK